MSQFKKTLGLFIMVDDEANVPLNSKGQPYILGGEPDSSIPGFIKFAETEVTFDIPPRTALAEAMKAKFLADRATLVEESAARVSALDSIVNRLTKGDPA